MHELSIVEALIEQVRREVERSGQSGRVRRLELAVGRLSSVNCDSLRFAFGLLAEDTLVAEAELQITQRKATCDCQACNARVEIDEVAVRCPACGSEQITVEGGQELLLQSIEIED
jgi:hydrogenase nickel incorporation protein HypA/HybF